MPREPTTPKRQCLRKTWYDRSEARWRSWAIQKIIRHPKFCYGLEATMPNLLLRSYLRVAIVVACIVQLGIPCLEAQNKKEKFDPDGAFWVHGQPPNEFSDFSAINSVSYTHLRAHET